MSTDRARRLGQIPTEARVAINTDETNRIATEMGIPHDRGFRCTHPGPALKRRMILVYGRCHHFADFEGFLAAGIGLVR